MLMLMFVQGSRNYIAHSFVSIIYITLCCCRNLSSMYMYNDIFILPSSKVMDLYRFLRDVRVKDNISSHNSFKKTQDKRYVFSRQSAVALLLQSIVTAISWNERL